MENNNEYILKLVEQEKFSIIPIVDGEKRPHSICLDENHKHNLLKVASTLEQVKIWIKAGVKSWAVACGKVSGNFIILDFDEKHFPRLYDLFYSKLSDYQKLWIDKCYKSSTRNHGTHIGYRTETSQPTIKLSSRVEFDKVTGKEMIVTTSETRGEGSYVLTSPSAGYTPLQGSLLDLPVIPDDLHEELIDIMRTFNEVEDEPATEYEQKATDSILCNRPGDRFNRKATWNEILEPHVWTEESKDRWIRPGKNKGDGISATTNYGNNGMLYVFSSSASPFKENTGYSKFHAFALLNHKGDYKEAAKVIAEKYPEEESDIQAQKESVMDRCNILLSEIPKSTPKEDVIKVLTPIIELLGLHIDQEEAEIYVRNKVKTELDIKTKDVESIVKHLKKTGFILRMKAKEESMKKQNGQVKENVSELDLLTETEKQVALQILKSPTLLFDILKMVKKLGVVGEERNVLLHYIIFTSRKLEQPLSATVKGDSSSGKSYTLLTAMKMLPQSAYIDLTDATPKSFYYCPDDHFKNKIIVIFEKHGGEGADYTIRTLQSEGKLKIQVTVKNPETGEFETKLIEKIGPTGFVTTTTAAVINSENDTRNISMFPDQSSAQTSRVYESVDKRYLGIPPINKNELKPWHHAQLCLEQLPVCIPFAKSFRSYFPKHIVRTRRDYGHFLAIVESVAFLHQKQREIVEIHGQKYIKATLADAYMATVIVEDTLSKTIYELPEKSVEVIQNASEIIEKSKADGDNDPIFTITSLAKKLAWDRDTVAKWLKPALKKGYITIATSSKGPKGAEYTLEAKELPGDTFLPTITDLVVDNPNERTDGIYDPLTGEVINWSPDMEMVSTDAPTESESDQNITQIEKDISDELVGASVAESEMLEKIESDNDYARPDDFADYLNSEDEKDFAEDKAKPSNICDDGEPF